MAGNTSMVTDGLIIASGKPVVTIGGFDGSDAAPTLAQFESMVRQGQLRYVLVSSGGFGGFAGAGGGSSPPVAESQPVAESPPAPAPARAGSGASGGFDSPGAGGRFFGPGDSDDAAPNAEAGRGGGGFPGFGGPGATNGRSGFGRNGTASQIDSIVEQHGTKVTVPGLSASESLYLITRVQVPAQ